MAKNASTYHSRYGYGPKLIVTIFCEWHDFSIEIQVMGSNYSKQMYFIYDQNGLLKVLKLKSGLLFNKKKKLKDF